VSLTVIAWFSAAIFIAGAMRGFTGFGFALAAVPLASLVLPPQQVVVAVLLMMTAVGLRDILIEHRRADLRSVGPMVAGMLAGTPLGVWALTALPVAGVRIALGGLAMAAVAITWRHPRPEQRGGRWLAALTGAASGICTGLAAMPGPPVIAYFMAFEPRVTVMRASMIVFFPIAAAAALPSAFIAGLIGQDQLILAATGLPAMITGTWLGRRGFERFGARSYRPAASAALLATAVAALAKGIAELG
jgi:uncharacterized membrane protein YfcA